MRLYFKLKCSRRDHSLFLWMSFEQKKRQRSAFFNIFGIEQSKQPKEKHQILLYLSYTNGTGGNPGLFREGKKFVYIARKSKQNTATTSPELRRNDKAKDYGYATYPKTAAAPRSMPPEKSVDFLPL